MKKLLLLLLTVPTVIWAEGTVVKFPAYCFAYADFIKKIEYFEEVPVMIGIKQESKEKAVVISVLHNPDDDTFSIVQFNNEVGCFLSVGKNLKFNMRGLKPQDFK